MTTVLRNSVRKCSLISIVSILLLLNFSATSVFGAEKVVTWKLGMKAAVTSLEVQAANKFAELVKEKSKGRMVIHVYPAGQLGDSIPQIENVIAGAQEMYADSMGWNSQFVKDFNALTMPFLIRDLDHLRTFLASSIYAKWRQQFIDAFGVRILADNWIRLPRVLVLKRPITGLRDLQGMKLRMPEMEVYYETWKAFGTGPVIIPWAECYMALRQGVVDGMDSPLSSVYGQRFFEVAPYIIMTNHQTDPFNVLVNEKAYQSLPDDLRALLTESAREAGVWYTELVSKSFQDEKALMEKAGAKFIEIDTTEFVKNALPLARKFEEKGLWSKGLFEAISSLK